MTKNKTDKFDITYLKSISNNDKTFIKEVLRLYVETSQIAVTKLESDLEKGDFKSIEFLLHRMRSSIMPFRDRKSTRLNSSHITPSRMPSSA